jgi:AP-4 complex subunit mu-1
VKKNGLYLVFANRVNISPTLVMELIVRLTKLFKDYCGVLTEESIRANFSLIYELLDEILVRGGCFGGGGRGGILSA